MTEKMTYTKALETVLVAGKGIYSDEVIEKLEALKASLEKRSATRSGKPTKAQREVAEFTETVYAALTDEPVRCGELATQLGVSCQKVSAALRKLVEAGRAVKTVGEKLAVLFTVAAE